MPPTELTKLDAQLQRLHLHYIQSHYQALATKAAEQQRSHLDYLEQLVEGEATMRENRSIERRIKNARFPAPPKDFQRASSGRASPGGGTRNWFLQNNPMQSRENSAVRKAFSGGTASGTLVDAKW